MREALVDTDIFSEILEVRDPNVVQTARQYLRVYRTFTISAVTLFETFKGLEYQPKAGITKAFEALKPNLQILPIEEDEAMVGGIIHGQLKRAGTSIGEMDPIIAATALNYGLPLITGNLSHYQRIIDRGFPLEIDDWRRQID